MPGRVFSREFNLSRVKAMANGEKTNTQIGREHQIDQSMLTPWKREHRDRGEAAFTPSTQQQVQGEVEALQARSAELERFIGQQFYEISVLTGRGTLRVQKALQKLASKNALT
ncbi:MAG TPA: transposase [Chloroflexia bacterium]|nr:transposase [Chloroflexia bacterium]